MNAIHITRKAQPYKVESYMIFEYKEANLMLSSHVLQKIAKWQVSINFIFTKNALKPPKNQLHDVHFILFVDSIKHYC